MSHSVTADPRTILPRPYCMAWIVCLSAGLFFFYEFLQLNIFDVINQPLREAFQLDATQLSWMSSTYLWADILFLLPAGVLLDRFSTRKIIILSMLVCVLGTLGFAMTSSFAVACFCRFLTGIGNAFCFLSCVVLIVRWFPPQRQALVIGLIITMAFVGGMVAHTPFAYLYAQFGWRGALWVDGLLGAVLLALICCVVKDKPEGAATFIPHHQGRVATSLKQALGNPQNWLAGLYTALLNLPIMVLCALWGASYLEVVHGLAPMAASNVVSLILMGSIVGCPLVGWLSDSMGKRKPLMIVGAIATSLALAPFFMHWNLTQGMLSVIFFALGLFTSTQVISYPLIAESNGVENVGAATGMASILIMGGGAVGQLAFGWLMAYHTEAQMAKYAILDFEFAMWMFPLTSIAALVAVLLIRETYCTRQ